jgi:hypothetical protein
MFVISDSLNASNSSALLLTPTHFMSIKFRLSFDKLKAKGI